MILLNTRPQPQADRFAQALVARFQDQLEIIASPLMQREFLPVAVDDAMRAAVGSDPMAALGGFEALVLTSETGAEAAGLWRNKGYILPQLAFCVGARTALAAQAQGFDTLSAQGDARALHAMIAARAERKLLYLHGEDRAADLAAGLAPLGFEVLSRVVYRQKALALSAPAQRALEQGDDLIVPLFSPRSARLFSAHLTDFPDNRVWAVVISENARKSLRNVNDARVFMAAHPDAPAMLDAIAECFAATRP